MGSHIQCYWPLGVTGTHYVLNAQNPGWGHDRLINFFEGCLIFVMMPLANILNIIGNMLWLKAEVGLII